MISDATARALALLAGPAIVPTLALVGARPMTVFLVPLVGAVLAALAAVMEAALGGSLLFWFVVLAVVANAAALVRAWPQITALLPTRFRRPDPGGDHRRTWRWPSVWSCLIVVVIAAAVAWPLQALRSPIIGYDGYAIWTLHALFVYGGHHLLRGDLTNPAYAFSNPSYPPLVPAGGALGFYANGGPDLRLAAVITGVLNACSLATVGCALAALPGSASRVPGRLVALAAGGCVCLIGFGLAGVYGVGGYADLLWAAAALAAVVTGLFLPPSTVMMSGAWVCATVAALTKNEGFVVAVLIFVLLAARANANRLPKSRAALTAWLRWFVRVGVIAGVMALPGVAWYAFVRGAGIGSDFVGRSSQSLGVRFHATALAIWANMHVLPLAVVIAVAGSVALLSTRRRLRLGNDLWLWAVVAGSMVALVVTYVFGHFKIDWWLSDSANRTTVFADLALYCDMAVWLVVVACTSPWPSLRQRREAVTRPSDRDRSVLVASGRLATEAVRQER